MKIKLCFLHVVATVLLFSLSQTLADPPVTFEVLVSFDSPGAGSTVANVINDRGQVGGWCVLDPLTVRGFIRLADGQFIAPISEPDSTDATYVTGLNNTGITSGYYDPDNGLNAGFLYSDSTFTTVDMDPDYTIVEKVNDAGNYCGVTRNGAFVNIGGTVTTFSVAGRSAGAEGINNLDQVVGGYTIGSTTYGYRRNADGTLDYPIAVPNVFFTGLHAINDRGWMVGNVSSATTGTHAVLFLSPNAFVLYDYPGAVETTFTGINSHGLICGNYYDDPRGDAHSFIVRVRLAAGE